MKNDAAARPAANEIALNRIISDIGKFSKVSKRKSRGVPLIKAN